MKLVSPLLKHIVYPSLAKAGYFRRLAPDGQLCVVTYHGVLPEGYVSYDPLLDSNLLTAATFRAQIRLLKERYQVVTPDDFLGWARDGSPLPPRAVLITCDDGLQNTLTEMVPILREEGLSCLFFVTGASTFDEPGMLWYEELYLLLMQAELGSYRFDDGISEVTLTKGNLRAAWYEVVKDLSDRNAQQRLEFFQRVRQILGQTSDWETAFRKQPGDRQRFLLLNRGELQLLAVQGMAIGAHTVDHSMLSRVSAARARFEIEQSRELLEATLHEPVWAFAYPFGNPGSVTAREVKLAKQAGYSCAFLNTDGGFGADLSLFALPRVHVNAGMSMPEFEAHVSGFHRSLRSRLSPPQNLVLGGAA